METTFFQRLKALIGSIILGFRFRRMSKEIGTDPEMYLRSKKLLDEIFTPKPCPFKLTDDEKKLVGEIIADSTEKERDTLQFRLPKDCPLEVEYLFVALNNEEDVFNRSFDYLYETSAMFKDHVEQTLKSLGEDSIG